MSQPSPISALWRPWSMIWFSVRLHLEILITALRQEGLSAFTNISRIRDAASAKIFSGTSNGFIAFENSTIVPSFVGSASGVILDLGPGAGNQLHRFDLSKVEYIYGVEPNPFYKKDIQSKIEENGLGGKYKLLNCLIEDSDVLQQEGIEEGCLDTVLCIQVLCAVKDPRSVMKGIYKLLKPGGRFIFWEHGRSQNWGAGIVQAFWNPGWSTFVGCSLTRDVLGDILDAGEWENPEEIEYAGDAFTCLPRIKGVLVKMA